MRDVDALCRELLGAPPDAVQQLVAFADRSSYRVSVHGEHFVVKTDDDARTTSNEIAGHRRALEAAVRVPELIGAVDDAFAMRWVEGVTLAEHPAGDAWRDAGAQLRVVHDVGAAAPFGTGFGGFNPSQPTWRAFFEQFADEMLTTCERDLGFPRAEGDRLRAALRDAPRLDRPRIAWCHGDLQPEHVLVDPATDRVTAIIDWADHGAGDFVWDVAVLTADGAPSEALLDGYRATHEERDALHDLLPLYRAVRLVGEAGWFAEHGLPYADILRRAREWRRA